MIVSGLNHFAHQNKVDDVKKVIKPKTIYSDKKTSVIVSGMALPAGHSMSMTTVVYTGEEVWDDLVYVDSNSEAKVISKEIIFSDSNGSTLREITKTKYQYFKPSYSFWKNSILNLSIFFNATDSHTTNTINQIKVYNTINQYPGGSLCPYLKY